MVDPILREFEQEAATTRRVLERVPLEKSDWKVHPKSTSLGNLAGWLAGGPSWTANALSVDAFDLMTWQPLAVPKTTAEMLAIFDRGVTEAKAAMEKLDDRRAEETWSFTMGDKKLMTFRRIDFLRLFLISDAIHHRGQFSVYLRLLDVPVPSIYGPSADDNPYFKG
jgi:uncharacterized damage-inducible protein DinB